MYAADTKTARDALRGRIFLCLRFSDKKLACGKHCDHWFSVSGAYRGTEADGLETVDTVSGFISGSHGSMGRISIYPGWYGIFQGNGRV